MTSLARARAASRCPPAPGHPPRPPPAGPRPAQDVATETRCAPGEPASAFARAVACLCPERALKHDEATELRSRAGDRPQPVRRECASRQLPLGASLIHELEEGLSRVVKACPNSV